MATRAQDNPAIRGELGRPPAADAGRARLDWKCVLRLELDDVGFGASVLYEFRSRLAADEAE